MNNGRILKISKRLVNALRAATRPTRHPERALDLLNRAASYLSPSFNLPSPFVDWMEDDELNNHFERFHDGPQVRSRRFFLKEMLKLVENVPGDTAEAGALYGSSSAIILRANKASQHPKMHHIFDSFQGLSQPHFRDGNYWSRGDLAVDESGLLLEPSDGNFTVHKGWIPQRFPEVEGRSFSFLHVDVDLYDPTKATLTFFLPLMSRGGVIVIDDYGSSRCPGATRAVNEIVSANDLTIVAVPQGGGFMLC